MSQPVDYQYHPYGDPAALKAAQPQMVNGQAQQNGMQPHFNMPVPGTVLSPQGPPRSSTMTTGSSTTHSVSQNVPQTNANVPHSQSSASMQSQSSANVPQSQNPLSPLGPTQGKPLQGSMPPRQPVLGPSNGQSGPQVQTSQYPGTQPQAGQFHGSQSQTGQFSVVQPPVSQFHSVQPQTSQYQPQTSQATQLQAQATQFQGTQAQMQAAPAQMQAQVAQTAQYQAQPPQTSQYQPQPPQTSQYQSQPPQTTQYQAQTTQYQTQPPPTSQYQSQPSQLPPYGNYYAKDPSGGETENVYREDGQRQGLYQPGYGAQRKYSYGTASAGANLNQKIPPPPFSGQRTYPGQPAVDSMNKRYPDSYPDQMNQLNNQMNMLGVTQTGFNKLWGMESVDLLQCRNVLPPEKVEPPKIKLHQEFLDSVNCNPDIFRCTLTKIPESNSLLQKSRLPLGVLIHPFKDLNQLLVIQCSTIVRCRACRTYINPFAYFIDSKRWKCNLCYRVNELPEEFQFDPVTKSYGDPSRRPEVKASTIEFVAPSEYMLRPPQPAVYLFVLDVSRLAVESGYLGIVCNVLAEELSRLPGDTRTQIGFLAVDSAIHFFSIPDNVSQPHEMIMLDIDDVFLPCPENLIVNLKEREELVRDLLAQLPGKFQGTHDTNCALGAALQAAYKLMSPTGGRVTVFQTCLPTIGPGLLHPREDPGSRTGKDVPHLNPVTDFYKRLALDCSGQQIAVDLFLLNSQYCDLATLSGMCKFSGGCIYHLPLFRASKPQFAEQLDRILRRYLTRKIGFEAVMRIRCTRGLSIHTFHGNFFVRSTDLLSLPNVNPDAGFGMQIAIEENLADVQNVCFQVALLYTSSKGERRIRVHTLCLPVVSNLADVLHSADQQCIIGLLSKMAVDRSQQSSLSDARDALINVAIDVLSAYKLSQSPSPSCGGLLAPSSLRLLPVYILALLKCVAFRSGPSTRLDDRLYSMSQLKSLPLGYLMQHVYPDLYPIHTVLGSTSETFVPGRMHLSAERVDSKGAYLMDAGDKIFVLVGKNAPAEFCIAVLGTTFHSLPEEMYELPELKTAESEKLRSFVFNLQEEKPYYASLQIIRDDSHYRSLFVERLIEDRFESALSYYEFLQHLKTQVK